MARLTVTNHEATLRRPSLSLPFCAPLPQTWISKRRRRAVEQTRPALLSPTVANCRPQERPKKFRRSSSNKTDEPCLRALYKSKLQKNAPTKTGFSETDPTCPSKRERVGARPSKCCSSASRLLSKRPEAALSAWLSPTAPLNFTSRSQTEKPSSSASPLCSGGAK